MATSPPKPASSTSPKRSPKKAKVDLDDPTLDRRTLPVSVLKGVGGKMAETLQKLGVVTIGDLLMHMPTRYARLAEVKPLAAWQTDDTARVEIDIEMALVRRGKRAKFVVAEGYDEKGKRVVLTWFGQHWLARQLPNTRVVVQGTVNQQLRERSPARITVKEWEYSQDLSEEDYREYLRPVYPATEGISQARLRRLVGLALDFCPRLPDALPKELRARYELCGIRQALEMVHRPQTLEEPQQGRHRLVFDEFFPAQMALLLLRRRDANSPATALSEDSLSEALTKGLPFELSEGQQKAWAHIRPRLHAETPARLLLQGEVGSGKTVLAALACAQAAASGKVSLLLAPTEILAAQHQQSLAAMLAPAGVQVELVTGSQKAGERREAIERLAKGESLVAVGTHALFSEGLEKFAFRLALVVVDEQHRFGVAQRHALVDEAQSRGLGVHLLQLSATPIPRTLAMTVFGDLDVVELPQRASAIRNVRTIVVGDEYGWLKPLKEIVALGEGGFVIAPKIEDDGVGWSVESPLLHRVWLKELKVGVAHGRQKSEERAEVLERFKAGDLDVLVATTVIEVGIDIPRASLIAVLDADHFGLAQLHQLRGRVGRAGQPALCLLQPSEEAGADGIARLQAMVDMDDGKELAQFDLELRGSGAFVGESQAGKSGFRLASLTRDGKTLVEARHAAKRLLEEDPTLGQPEHSSLRHELLQRVAGMLAVRKS